MHVRSPLDGTLMHAGTSKAGVDMVTKVMALELGPHKVSDKTKKYSNHDWFNRFE